MNYIVNPETPYDLNKIMHKLGMDPQYKVNWAKEEVSFAIRVKWHKEEKQWKKGIVTLTNEGSPDQPQIRVHFFGDELIEDEREWLMENLAFRFQMTENKLPAFYQAVQNEPILSELVQTYRGLAIVLEEGIYECLIKTIIHQQVNLRFARQLVVDLAKEYGDTLVYNYHEYAFFPTASQLAKVEVEELRKRKFSQRKAEYVIDLARKIAQGELDLDTLSMLDNQSIINKLTAERGVGVWTVECLLLFGLGRANLFPAGDLGIRNALKKALGLEERPSVEECREWIKAYEQWGSYVAIYCWESLGHNKGEINN